MKKLLVVLIAVLLFVGCGVVASAAEVENSANVTKNVDTVYENEEPTAGESNPFAELYAYVCENADNIFSALAFMASVVLAFIYKKGLMPALTSSLGNIRTSVKTISETAEKALVESEGAYAGVKHSIDLVGEGLDTLCISMGELEKRLKATEEQANEAKAMKTIMSAQIDMLYIIFMSSSLPQYSKDAVGERIAEMKAALADVATAEE